MEIRIGGIVQDTTEADRRDRARLDGLQAGVQFRSTELRYDALPRWRCRDCGCAVYGGRWEALQYPTAFAMLHMARRCMKCSCAAVNRVLKKEDEKRCEA